MISLNDFTTRPNHLMRLTPPLSRQGIAEVVAELSAPPSDTPERRATFARARAASFLVRQTWVQVMNRRL
ncbi:hypothetical protein [Longimicrobium sp.]|uniref:hypothetical protein n=1 Tax=Longimicrobium sp. TaxID=2029185 RepID=UPI002C63FAEC|nr:hypothetical protein [Longimicrobium sp.]HSU14072.1 hypothetical protein [Longimicrobium sp.]